MHTSGERQEEGRLWNDHTRVLQCGWSFGRKSRKAKEEHDGKEMALGKSGFS